MTSQEIDERLRVIDGQIAVTIIILVCVPVFFALLIFIIG